MEIIDAASVARFATFPDVASSIAAALCQDVISPPRSHYDVVVPCEESATLLTMPAWQEGKYIGVKIAAVFPGNVKRLRPSVTSQFFLLSGTTGQPLAIIDGDELTVRRTAAASALAAQFLARPDSTIMTMVGTGRLSRPLIEAHTTLNPYIKTVFVWGRSKAKAGVIANSVNFEGVVAGVADDLESAVRSSDLISVATLSRSPLINGNWLQSGAHLDLVGGFKPHMREADDAAILRSTIFCDTREGAILEAGDLSQPIADGLIDAEQIIDLYMLCRGQHAGRCRSDEITLFKSVGFATEDFATAVLVYERWCLTHR